MTRLSLCLPYYRNPQMLAHQYAVWAAYAVPVKAQLEVVIVDDGSPASETAAAVPRPHGLPPLRLYRVLEDRPWHQHGARNLAAHEAAGPWLLMTDMDHELPASSAADLLDQVARATGDEVFTFHRVDAPDLVPKRDVFGGLHPHPNTFAVTRDRYWQLGGYDEDCTGYGTDGFFRTRLFEAGRARHLASVPVVRYPREVIADASTRAPEGVRPQVFRDRARRTQENRNLLAEKRRSGRGPTVLNFPWERVL